MTQTVARGFTATLGDTEPLDVLEQVTHAASADESRQVLTGVYLEIGRREVRATVTDSYQLVSRQVWEVEGDVAPFAIILEGKALRDACKLIRKAQRATGAPYVVEVTTEGATFTHAAGVTKVPAIEGEFPNYRQLIPTDTGEVAAIGLSPAVFLKIAKGLGVEKSGAIVARFSNPLRPIRVEVEGTEKDWALWMPVRLP